MLNVEDNPVTVKCRTSMEAPFLYLCWISRGNLHPYLFLLMYNQAALPQTLLSCCHADKYAVMEITMLSWRYISFHGDKNMLSCR